MLVKQYQQKMVCLCVLAAIILWPISVLAGDEETTVFHESGLYYTIQKGDTLWDLSQHFSDSAWQWPDLWTENGQIPNPHWIYPGERIRLIRKNGADQFLSTSIAAPVSAVKTPGYYYSLIDQVGFIRKEAVQPMGTIFKVKDDKEMISQEDLVYIRQTGAIPLQVGQKLTVYRTLNPKEIASRQNKVGIQHYLTGVVEITKVDPHFTMAKVVRSFRAMQVGDLLMPHKRRSPHILFNESEPELLAKIIISEEHEKIFAEDTVAFIDKGELDGVTPGQSYKVYYQESQQLDPDSKERVMLDPVDFATLIVLHTEETTATVLVTQSEKDVYAGAFVRTPAN